MIRFKCPHCDAACAVEHSYAGQDVECYNCHLAVKVPLEFAAAPKIVRRIGFIDEDEPLIQTPVRSDKRKQQNTVGLIIAIGATTFGLLVIGLMFIGEPAGRGERQPRLRDGDMASIAVPIGKETVVVCTSLRALEKWGQASRTGDMIGFGKLLDAGDIVLCTNGTRVKILDTGIEQHEIRIMEGEHFGVSGWVDVGHVQKK